MSKWVSVVYAYKPKNDDELELKVGDEIEVLEYVEDGKLLMITIDNNSSMTIFWYTRLVAYEVK